jgi:hypothetical protein
MILASSRINSGDRINSTHPGSILPALELKPNIHKVKIWMADSLSFFYSKIGWPLKNGEWSLWSEVLKGKYVRDNQKKNMIK